MSHSPCCWLPRHGAAQVGRGGQARGRASEALPVWDRDEEEIILNSNPDPEGRGRYWTRGWARGPGGAGAPWRLCSQAAVPCAPGGTPALRTGWAGLLGLGPGRALLTVLARGTGPSAVPIALGAGWAAALPAGGLGYVLLQPVPGQVLLLRDECGPGGGSSAQAPRARPQAVALGAAHAADGRLVGCPASTRGSRLRGRVPGPLVRRPGVTRAVLVLRAAAAGHPVPAPPRPGCRWRDPDVGLGGLCRSRGSRGWLRAGA